MGLPATGGGNSSGGTVFSLTPPLSGRGAWTESDLYLFQGDTDGSLPFGTLALDIAGALYGTTVDGSGNVFQLTPPSGEGGGWTESVLYAFQGAGDGSQPASGVIFDTSGALYGTTQFGGDFSCSYNGTDDGCGTAFKLVPPSTAGGAWTEQTLHAFSGSSDGVNPGLSAPLLIGNSLYGTAAQGGIGNPQFCSTSGCGVVFTIDY
jgi:hypothetical protein